VPALLRRVRWSVLPHKYVGLPGAGRPFHGPSSAYLMFRSASTSAEVAAGGMVHPESDSSLPHIETRRIYGPDGRAVVGEGGVGTRVPE
jgi:hypothetical protein